MDITLLALFCLCVVLVGIHTPHLTLTLLAIIAAVALVTRLSWSVLNAFESVELESVEVE